MILVDTSVWIDYLETGNARIESLVAERSVLQHPFVTGELACGRLRDREEVLSFLSRLRQAPIIDQQDVLRLLDDEQLYGHGLVWVDVNLFVLIRLALDALIQREVARKLIALGGTMPGLELPRRRRPWQEHRMRKRKRTAESRRARRAAK